MRDLKEEMKLVLRERITKEFILGQVIQWDDEDADNYLDIIGHNFKQFSQDQIREMCEELDKEDLVKIILRANDERWYEYAFKKGER